MSERHDREGHDQYMTSNGIPMVYGARREEDGSGAL
jgi:hypothetical protein